MKYFIVSDIHSHYQLLTKALSDAGFNKSNPNHTFVTLGDNFDRGRESAELLSFLLSLDENRVVYVKGNHECLLEDVLQRQDLRSFDIYNGTATTILDLLSLPSTLDLRSNHFDKVAKMVGPLLERMVNYLELGNYILIHSSLPVGEDSNLDPNWRNADSSAWKKATFANPFLAAESGILQERKLIFGHWNTSWAWKREGRTSNDIYYSEQYIGIDANAAVSKKINVLVIEDSE